MGMTMIFIILEQMIKMRRNAVFSHTFMITNLFEKDEFEAYSTPSLIGAGGWFRIRGGDCACL